MNSKYASVKSQLGSEIFDSVTDDEKFCVVPLKWHSKITLVFGKFDDAENEMYVELTVAKTLLITSVLYKILLEMLCYVIM